MDVIVTRHLVWTLVDPAAAFAEWYRVLKPGGSLLLVDGDFVSRGWLARMLSRKVPSRHENAQRHQNILARVYFSGGARAGEVAGLLQAAGFSEVTIDHRLGRIHRAQAKQLGWRKSMLRRCEHRYAICARKPSDEA
jgi:SAM-dependent methyltransferase